MTDLVLNKNFYNYICGLLFGGVYKTTTAAAIGTSYNYGKGYYDEYSNTLPAPMTDISGTQKDGLYFSSTSDSYSAWNHTFFIFNNYGTGVTFSAGSGSTAATIDDTALVAPNTNITVVVDSGKRDTTTSITYTVTFSATTEQTLQEIGLQRRIMTASNTYSPILLGRAVLDEPVTLDADHSLTLQIRLALPIPA